ncbi:hypothetical protein sos41_41330 [Alphaproteobacteria bacterium SO-S41]|nr:hypothetical protein sos41_41330 [Alphaproteobacteria bacterium SO-S41]
MGDAQDPPYDDGPPPNTRQNGLPDTIEDGLARWREALPFALLVLGLAAFLAAGGDHRLTPEALQADAVALADWAYGHSLLAPFAYLGSAIAASTLAVPGGAVVTMAGGTLFGAPLGACLALLGATTGAGLLMLAARAALRPMLRRNFSPWLIRAEQALQRHGFLWLLAPRLALPFAPFAVTLLAAALGARLRPFLAATALGSLPGTVLLTLQGAALAVGAPARANILLAWPIPLIGVGLALIALSPMVLGLRARKD